MTAEPFAALREVTETMRSFHRPWFVAGGWAIDLFVGRETRAHEDVDLAIFRADQGALRNHFEGWSLSIVVHGPQRPWSEGESLERPIHEIHATRTSGRPNHLEFLLDETADDEWRYRRNLSVARPLGLVGHRRLAGIPSLAPEIVLLYKAKAPTEKDEHDFDVALPWLDAEPRDWLRGALEECHPTHPWIARL